MCVYVCMCVCVCVCVCVRARARVREREREFYVCAIEIFRTADVLALRSLQKQKSSKSVLRTLKFVTKVLYRLAPVLCSTKELTRSPA